MLGKRVFAALAIGTASLASIGLARPAFAAAGGLDPTFGNGGKVLTPVCGIVDNALLQSNGDIVVGGTFGILRYLPNGSLDNGFGRHGLAADPNGAAGLAMEPNGEFLAVGETPNPDREFAVARFTASGVLDPAFGHGGVVTTPFPNAPDGAGADAVLVEPNGDILVGGLAMIPGTTRNQPIVTLGALARYTPNGTLDTSFGNGGLVQSTAAVGDIANLGIDATGDIFVLPAHAEFSPAGQLDSGVTAATITVSSTGGPDAFLSSGQSLIASSVGVGRAMTDVKVQRFNADGTVDPAFNNPQFTYTGAQFAGHQSTAAITVQPDGKVVVVGASFFGTSVFGAARLNSTGSLDSGFGNAGVLTTSFQGDDIARAVLVQPNGDIVAIGFSEDNSAGAVSIALARYLG
ncbi:MAG: hypothetical protein JO037_26685 [Actinobacteria bacterium]|nr:hypothetical protein [Actinomycetota bacterium]